MEDSRQRLKMTGAPAASAQYPIDPETLKQLMDSISAGPNPAYTQAIPVPAEPFASAFSDHLSHQSRLELGSKPSHLMQSNSHDHLPPTISMQNFSLHSVATDVGYPQSSSFTMNNASNSVWTTVPNHISMPLQPISMQSISTPYHGQQTATSFEPLQLLHTDTSYSFLQDLLTTISPSNSSFALNADPHDLFRIDMGLYEILPTPLPPCTYTPDATIIYPHTINEYSVPASYRSNESSASPPAVEPPLPPINISKSSISRRARCTVCQIGIGLVLLYGSKNELADPVKVEVRCVECAGSEGECSEDGEGTVTTSSRKRRVKASSKNGKMHCEACRKLMGVGGVRLVAGENSNGTLEREWVEPRAGAEPICEHCVRNFDFCTQCGGSGTFRTGKWRPRQLFHAGKKTCSLYHDRLGAVHHFQVTSLLCPSQPLLDATQKPMMHFDPLPQIERTDPIIQSYLHNSPSATSTGISLLSAWKDKLQSTHSHALSNSAIPQRMRENPQMGTWEKIEQLEKITMATYDFWMLGARLSLFPPPDPSTLPIDPLNVPRRYCILVEALPASKPQGRRATVSKTTKPSQGPGPRLIGLLFADWYPAKRNVHFAMGEYHGKDGIEEGVEAPFTTMYRAVVTRITSDAAQLDQEIPLYVWGRFFRTEMEKGTKEFKEMRRYGFLPMEEHCRRFGGVEEDLERSFTVWLHLWHGMVKGLAGPGDLVTTVCRWTDLVASVRK